MPSSPLTVDASDVHAVVVAFASAQTTSLCTRRLRKPWLRASDPNRPLVLITASLYRFNATGKQNTRAAIGVSTKTSPAPLTASEAGGKAARPGESFDSSENFAGDSILMHLTESWKQPQPEIAILLRAAWGSAQRRSLHRFPSSCPASQILTSSSSRPTTRAALPRHTRPRAETMSPTLTSTMTAVTSAISATRTGCPSSPRRGGGGSHHAQGRMSPFESSSLNRADT